jgi:hypothetical protein
VILNLQSKTQKIQCIKGLSSDEEIEKEFGIK